MIMGALSRRYWLRQIVVLSLRQPYGLVDRLGVEFLWVMLFAQFCTA